MPNAPQPGAIIEISDILQSLCNRGWTGTLEVIEGEQDRRTYLYFQGGVVQHVRSTAAQIQIGIFLFKMRRLDLADVNFALTLQERTGRTFTELCIDYELVTDTDIHEAMVQRGREDIMKLIAETADLGTRVHAGEEPLAGVFDAEDLAIQLKINPMGLLLEAMRRQDEWKRIRNHIESTEEVLVRADDLRAVAVEHRPIFLLCDGFHTVEEVALYSPFEETKALGLIRDLYSEGLLKRVGPLEIANAAIEAERLNDAEKALRLFELAERRGLNRVEVSKRIAIAHQQLGHRQRAIKRWFIYAERCAEIGDYANAIEAYRQIISVEVTTVKAYEAIADLLIEMDNIEQAAIELKNLIDVYRAVEDHAGLVRAYERYLDLQPSDEASFLALAEVHRLAGEGTEAIHRLDQVAQLRRGRGDVSGAIEIYQHILTIDEGCLHGRLALAKILSETGRTQEAVDQYKLLASILLSATQIENSTNEPALFIVYESIVKLSPATTESWEWLARAYEREGKIALAVQNYLGMAESLQGDPTRRRDMIEPMERVITLTPDRLDVRREHMRLLFELGELDRGVRAALALANQAITAGDRDQARKAYQVVLGKQPLNLPARAGQARLAELEGKRQVAVRRWRTVGGLALRAGLYERAVEALRKARALEPGHGETLWELAEALGALLQELEAAEIYAEYAERMIAEENYGRAREAIRRAQALAPGFPALSELARRVSQAPSP